MGGLGMRRGGILGMAVTASKAATAGGMAVGSCREDMGVRVRADLAAAWCCVRGLAFWAMLAGHEGERGGMTTGLEWASMVVECEAGAWTGLMAGRAPMLSDEGLRLEGGGWWRYGKERGDSIIVAKS